MEDAGFQEASETFMAWLSAQPGVEISPKIALHDYSEQNGGRGVIATADIEADETLFTVPRSTLLSFNNSDLKEHLSSSEYEALDEWQTLILVMLYENCRQSSHWSAYFQILPESFSTPMFWSPEELEELKGSTLLSKIGREEADQSYHEVIEPILLRNPTCFDRNRCTIHDFHRMASIIMAYSFDSPLDSSSPTPSQNSDSDSDDEPEKFEKVMCPLSDLLNADTNLNNARLFYHPSSLSMAATQFIKSGAQVYNTYGDLPNSDLLRRYGYIQQDNPFDVVEVPGDAITSLFEMSEDERLEKVDFLLDCGILDDAFEVDQSAKVPKEMIVTVSVMALHLDVFRKLKKRTMTNGDAELVKLGVKTVLAKDVIGKTLRDRLSGYGTSLAHDLGVLKSTHVPYNARNAIAVRASEKRILEAAIAAVDGWIVEGTTVLASRATSESTGTKKRSGADDTAETVEKKSRKR